MNQNMPEMVAVWELKEKSSSYFYWTLIESVIMNFYQDVGYIFFSKLVNMFKTKCTLFVCQLHSRLMLM